MASTHPVRGGVVQVFALGALLAACDGGAPADEALVEVPTIDGDVASADFCALYDTIACAAAVGCCSGAEAAFDDASACEAASTCDADMRALLASPSVVAGAVVYDAAAAGDFLRAQAADASGCDPSRDTAAWAFAAFVGTLAEGADCATAPSDDGASALRCGPGLACLTTSDAAEETETSICGRVDTAAGENGGSCTDDEGCASGSCVDHVCQLGVADAWCAVAEAPEVPSNATSVSTDATPEGLRVTANSNTNSGTTNDITLCYRNQTATWCCTITATIADGGSQECVPTASSLTTDTTYDTFYVKYADSNNTDGLRITELAVKRLGLWDTHGTFSNKSGVSMTCTGCNMSGDNCNSCWIDSDDHDDCLEIKSVRDQSRSSYCIDYN